MQSLSTTMTSLTALNRLVRLPLAAMVALSALAGALAAAPGLPWLALWALGWGIFLLTAACSVLNQVQERFTDALMTRTCTRPIASGMLAPRAGAGIGLLLGTLGLVLLHAGHGRDSALLGLAAMAWYLLVYTPLKRVTPFAVIAGTPCGVLPPLIGWHAATGLLLEPQALALGLVMLLWQVPHYWLLALPDRAELQRAGFKVLPVNLSNPKLLHLCHFWSMALVSTTLLLPLLDLLAAPLLQSLVVGVALSFAVWATRLQRRALFIEATARRLRLGLHLYLGLVLGAILMEGLLARLFV